MAANYVYDKVATMNEDDFKKEVNKLSTYDMKLLRRLMKDDVRRKVVNSLIRQRMLPVHGCITLEEHKRAIERYEWSCRHK